MKKKLYERSYATFTNLLKEQRQDAGLTQAQLAQKLRRPQSYVSKYERGERRLDVIEFLEVAQAIGFDPVEIFHELNL